MKAGMKIRSTPKDASHYDWVLVEENGELIAESNLGYRGGFVHRARLKDNPHDWIVV